MRKITINNNNFYIIEDGIYSIINRNNIKISFFISKIDSLEVKDINTLNYTKKTLKELSKHLNNYKLAIKKYKCYEVFK